jgi:NAD(P)-dependent dehydrogenase (short-subunit alcohol dehydrogenase family)
MGRLDGKVAVITGAARGQGKAAAQRFVEEGAKVALTDLLEEELQETATEIRDLGGEVVAVAGDVTDAATIDALVTQAVSELGGIHVLHNNAGRMLGGTLESYTLEDFDNLMHVNCYAHLLTIQRCVPEMRKAGTGSIINVSSIGGLAAFPNMSLYSASKGAVIAFTRGVAFDLAPDIRCNAICPGAVDTPMPHVLADAFDDHEAALESMYQRQLLKRFADPIEMANVALFLASDESSFITGVALPVEAGWTAW